MPLELRLAPPRSRSDHNVVVRAFRASSRDSGGGGGELDDRDRLERGDGAADGRGNLADLELGGGAGCPGAVVAPAATSSAIAPASSSWAAPYGAVAPVAAARDEPSRSTDAQARLRVVNSGVFGHYRRVNAKLSAGMR